MPWVETTGVDIATGSKRDHIVGSGHCNGVETGPYRREWTLQRGQNGAISSGVDIAAGLKRE